MFQRLMRISLVSLMGLAVSASACPMCVEALSGDSNSGGNLPNAFGYSVLFMLSMPFLVVTGFSFYFYALSRPARPVDQFPSITSDRVATLVDETPCDPAAAIAPA